MTFETMLEQIKYGFYPNAERSWRNAAENWEASSFYSGEMAAYEAFLEIVKKVGESDEENMWFWQGFFQTFNTMRATWLKIDYDKGE